MTDLRLVTFNAQHAAPDRARRQAAWLGRCPDADLVVLTEVGHGPGGHALLDALAHHGYTHIHAPRPSLPDYSTVIASRRAPLEPVPTGIDVLAHRAPAVDLRIGGQRLRLVGLYVPSRGPAERRNENKRAFQHAVTRALPSLLAGVGGPVVVTGDLNVVEPGHVPHYPVFGRWEYDFYRSFNDTGLTDAYRALHPDTPGYSWYGRGGNGYRFDHTFLTADRLGLTGCDYLHGPRDQGLSDHAALHLTALLTPASDPVTRAEIASR
jgi:exonuclease III